MNCDAIKKQRTQLDSTQTPNFSLFVPSNSKLTPSTVSLSTL